MKSSLFIFILFISSLAIAGQNAIVITDGAMVYKRGNFDSQVIGYLRQGQKVRVSNKTFGPFYRVAFKQGVIGYIADIDIRPENSPTRGGKKSDTKRSSKKTYLSKYYLGPALAMVNYTDTINNKTFSDGILMYGAKFNSPFPFLDGPFISDINFLYSSETPNFYKSFSATTPKSTFLFLDLNILFSFYENESRSLGIYAGGGPLITYTSITNIDLANTNENIELTESIIGGNLTAGTALRFSKLALRLEARYYVLKSQSLGFLGSLQYEF